jgi:hypothetical protein
MKIFRFSPIFPFEDQDFDKHRNKADSVNEVLETFHQISLILHRAFTGFSSAFSSFSSFPSISTESPPSFTKLSPFPLHIRSFNYTSSPSISRLIHQKHSPYDKNPFCRTKTTRNESIKIIYCDHQHFF